jgi:chemotaxis protein MotB
MWLLNSTTEAQRTGLADYFAPTNLFGRSISGSGKPFGGKTPNDPDASVSSDGMPQVIKGLESPQPDLEATDTDTLATPQPKQDQATDELTDGTRGAADTGADPDQPRRDGYALQSGSGRQAIARGGDYAAARLTPEPNQKIPTDPTAADVARHEAAAVESDSQREQQAMEQAGAKLMAAIRSDPALKDEAGQIMVDTVPEGLRIQVVDAERRPMFALGSAVPTPQIRAMMQKVVPALAGLPNAISIAGHTDALLYRGPDKDNWVLSTDRANAIRKILVEAGLPDGRIRSVTGNADRDLLMPNDPLNPANRRISIIVLRHAVRDGAASSAKNTSAAGTPATVTVASGAPPTGTPTALATGTGVAAPATPGGAAGARGDTASMATK